MKKKTYCFIILITFSFGIKAQTMKNYSGAYPDPIGNNGNSTYSYYENAGKIIKHGSFSYSWSGVEDNKGSTKSIKGKFKDGLRDGQWTFSVSLKDNPLGGVEHLPYDGNDLYSTGNIILTANYLNGYPHGQWILKETLKDRHKIWNYGSWKWSAYLPSKSRSLILHFDKGQLVGKYTYADEFNESNIKGVFDANGFFKDEWIYQGGQVQQKLTFAKGIQVTYLKLDIATGKIEKKEDNSEKLSKVNEADDLFLDTISIFSNPYHPFVLSFKKIHQIYFNYEEIGGDLAYQNKHKGAFAINIIEAVPLIKSICSYNWGYSQAEGYFNYGNYEKALSGYVAVLKCEEEKIYKERIIKSDIEALKDKIDTCKTKLASIKLIKKNASKIYNKAYALLLEDLVLEEINYSIYEKVKDLNYNDFWDYLSTIKYPNFKDVNSREPTKWATEQMIKNKLMTEADFKYLYFVNQYYKELIDYEKQHPSSLPSYRDEIIDTEKGIRSIENFY